MNVQRMAWNEINIREKEKLQRTSLSCSIKGSLINCHHHKFVCLSVSTSNSSSYSPLLWKWRIIFPWIMNHFNAFNFSPSFHDFMCFHTGCCCFLSERFPLSLWEINEKSNLHSLTESMCCESEHAEQREIFVSNHSPYFIHLLRRPRLHIPKGASSSSTHTRKAIFRCRRWAVRVCSGSSQRRRMAS